jgi:hypothetical protein
MEYTFLLVKYLGRYKVIVLYGCFRID